MCLCLLTIDPGDLFILVYSIDKRESFDEVQRLQDQIFETKARAASSGGDSWRKRNRKQPPYVPMVIVGNKCERAGASAGREVETSELMRLADGRPSCGCLEASAKKNINVEEIFLKLFMLANLPTEMTPSLHRKVQPSYVVTSSPRGSRRRMTLRRRLSDAYGAVTPDVRRPSIRTDLLIVKTKQNLTAAASNELDANGGGSRRSGGRSSKDTTKKCCIQ